MPQRIDLSAICTLCKACGAKLLPQESLAEHTTFRIGGSCAAMIVLPDLNACKMIFPFLRDQGIPHKLIGSGSNLLIHDTGYEGVILKLGKAFEEAPALSESGLLHCGAGGKLKSLCLGARDAGLSGLEFAYGIPGSVGGAVYMNAGAYGGEIADVLDSVTFLDENNAIRSLPSTELLLSYRHSIFMERPWQILFADFRLEKGNREQIAEQMQKILARRISKQPLDLPSAGSTFKRPSGSYASLLIDRCGLKGYRVGGAQVSEKHAGFVINRGGATFADVMAVCKHIQETVHAQTGYTLELEPEIL